MSPIRSAILASAALVLMMSPAVANEPRLPIVLAQADTAAAQTPLAQAEAAVEAARADLRNAMSGNGNVREARRELRRALQHLQELQDNPAAAAAAPAAQEAETPVVTEAPAPVEPETPPVAETPAAPAETPAVAETPAQPLPPLDQIEITPEGQIVAPETQTAQPETPAVPEVAPEATPPAAQPGTQTAEEPDRRRGRGRGDDAPPVQTAEPETPAEPETAATPDGEPVAVQTEDDGRVILRDGSGRLQVRSDDSGRLGGEAGARRRVDRGNDGTTTATITRPDGTEVVTVRDEDGEIVQRYRKRPNGEIDILIGEDPRTAGRDRRDGRRPRDRERDGLFSDFLASLPQIRITIPQEEYVVESESASRQQLERALTAPPVEEVERTYTLGEVRTSGRLRNKLRRIDVDTITFEFGSANIPDDQIARMQQIGNALSSVISRDPDEVFLLEGHTDAVGTDLANLALSDRRAESVAYVLSTYFGIPPENLVTQGYGEYYLKVPTAEAERENRRVTLRRITPLLRGGS